MPHQATTAAARALRPTASRGPGVPSGRGRQRHRLKAAAPVTHAILATITAPQTAAATRAYSTASEPVTRKAIDLSWKPTRMNASTFNTKTATSQNAHDGTRM